MSQLFAELVDKHSGSKSEQGLRSAALTLHAMGDTDRAWLLGRLNAAQRQELGLLLAELQALGVPSDWQGTRDLLFERGVGAPSETDPMMTKIADAPATAVANVLAAEPAGLIELVMAVSDWSWRAEVLAMLQVRQGAAIRDIDAGAKLEPKLGRLESSGPVHEKLDTSELVRATLRHLATQLSHVPAVGTRPAISVAGWRLRALWRKPFRRKPT